MLVLKRVKEKGIFVFVFCGWLLGVYFLCGARHSYRVRKAWCSSREGTSYWCVACYRLSSLQDGLGLQPSTSEAQAGVSTRAG
jgi:hypothetical protein